MSEPGTEKLRILFFGELLPGADRANAEGFLSKRFRLNEDKLKQVMSGRKVALRINLDQSQAFALQAELEAAGLVTRIETMPRKGKSPAASASPAQFEIDDPRNGTRSPKPVAPADVDAQASARVQTKAAVLEPEAPAPVAPPPPAPTPANRLPCPACRKPVAHQALHCPWCGERLRRAGHAWVWTFAAVGLVMILVVPLVTVFALPNLASNLGGFGRAWQSSSPEEQVAAGQAQAVEVQAAIRNFVERTNFWPNSTLDAGLGAPEDQASEVLSRVEVGANALITIHFRPELPEIGGHTLVYIPERDPEGLPIWRCSGGTLPDDWLPNDCESANTPQPQPPVDTVYELPETDVPAELPPLPFVRRVLSNELTTTRWLRDEVMTYYRDNGRWPDSHESLGLEDPFSLGSYAMRQIRVEANGQIRYEFSSALELIQGEVVMLTGDSRTGQWRCESRLPIEALPPSCSIGFE